MKALDFRPVDILFPSSSVCYQIPSFQRNYQWSLSSAHSLVQSIYEAATKGGDAPYWIGVMLFGNSPFECPISETKPGHRCRQVLDGQQRILTARLWLLALVDEYKRQTGEEPERFARSEFANTQVHSLDELDWSQIENEKILKLKAFPIESGSPRHLTRNYLYFRFLIFKGLAGFEEFEELAVPQPTTDSPVVDEWADEFADSVLSPSDLIRVIESTLTTVAITVLNHEESDGDVERIFETLNSKNTPLGQYDLFRNFILMRGASSQAERREMYTSQMKDAERLLNGLKGLDLRQTRNYLDAFLQDFVSSIASTSESVSATSSARVFQSWWNQSRSDDEVRTFLHDELIPAMRAWAVAIKAEGSLDLGDGTKLELPTSALRSLARIENLARRSFVPVTMTIIAKWELAGDNRSEIELLRHLKAVETYIARSILAGKTSSPFRGTSVRAVKVARDGFDGEGRDLVEWFATQTETDSSVKRAVLQSVSLEDGTDRNEQDWWVKRDVAQRLSTSAFAALIDGLACQLEGEAHVTWLMLKPGEKWTPSKKLEIEHLYPQNSSRWQEDLGNWGTSDERMKSRLHSLGNTTVLPRSANSKSNNLRLEDKQEILNRDGVPNFKVSEEFFAANVWTHESIDARSKRLCDVALRCWSVGGE